MFLAVAVDAADPLLQPDGVPGDVVVDHQPAELQVDAFAGRLGGDEHLGRLAELALGVDARSRRVAVADLHAAVDLGDGQAPLAELAERAAVAAVAGEVVERVLVLGEDEQLHLRVGEEAVFGQHGPEFGRASIWASRASSPLAWSISRVSRPISSRRTAGSADEHHAFELADDLAAAPPRSGRRSRRGSRCSICSLPVGFGVVEDLLPPVAHPLQAAAHGVDGRGHAALEHGHREADGPAAGGLVAGGRRSTGLRRSGSARRRSRVRRRRGRRRRSGPPAW